VEMFFESWAEEEYIRLAIGLRICHVIRKIILSWYSQNKFFIKYIKVDGHW
jgi:hypothetical protein